MCVCGGSIYLKHSCVTCLYWESKQLMAFGHLLKRLRLNKLDWLGPTRFAFILKRSSEGRRGCLCFYTNWRRGRLPAPLIQCTPHCVSYVRHFLHVAAPLSAHFEARALRPWPSTTWPNVPAAPAGTWHQATETKIKDVNVQEHGERVRVGCPSQNLCDSISRPWHCH